MNRISLGIFLIFSSFFSFAQTPVSPELCLVTVGEDSIVQLKWNHLDTSQIDGFIVKRVIYNGVGVVSGTLNNIEVIENQAAINYFDNSNEYSTHSNPYIRAEEYAINTLTPALVKGGFLPEQERIAVAKKMAYYSGLSEKY